MCIFQEMLNFKIKILADKVESFKRVKKRCADTVNYIQVIDIRCQLLLSLLLYAQF